jgi:hypothetical protein
VTKFVNNPTATKGFFCLPPNNLVDLHQLQMDEAKTIAAYHSMFKSRRGEMRYVLPALDYYTEDIINALQCYQGAAIWAKV